MKQISNAQPLSSGISDRTLTINLLMQAPDDISIRSCEVVGRHFRSRFSFTASQKIEDVLAARLAHTIACKLRSVPENTHVLSLPDFLLELPGLVLAGAHIMVMGITHGVHSVILRFREFIGAVNNAFQVDVGLHEPIASQGERLAMGVLEDICLPTLNLCHALDNLAQQQGHQVSSQIREKAREFQFQTELLKRFVSSNAMTGESRAERYVLNNRI